jgi:prevent-host-death family protein
MRKVNMHEAKSTLSELVRLALEGEDVVVARNGEPLVRLVPLHSTAGFRPAGLHRLASSQLTESFLTETLRPADAEELESWAGPVFPDEDDA